MIYDSKDIFKNYSTSCGNTHHDVLTFEVDWLVQNMKKYQEQNTAFSMKQKNS